jgi:collagen type IV alpha-3-binding protein
MVIFPVCVELNVIRVHTQATTSAILSTLGHCIELMVQREESWKKKYDREVEKRKKFEEMYSASMKDASEKRLLLKMGPDFEEGPHSALNEEEFFDAVETGLDKIEEEDMWRKQTSERTERTLSQSPAEPLQNHPLWPRVAFLHTFQIMYLDHF